MATTTKRPRADAGSIRRYYDRARLIVPGWRARRDVIALLEERKALARAAEGLVAAAIPYSGDAAVKAAIDGVRVVLEGAPRG